MRDTTRTRTWDDVDTRPLTLVMLTALAVLAFASLAPAQTVTPRATVHYAPGGGGKVFGTIVSRKGDDILIRDESNGLATITLVPGTRITSPTGFLNLDRKSQNVTSLIPGLIIKVNGSGGPRGNLIADRISFHRSALRVAQQINAGEVDLKSQQRVTYARAVANSDSVADATTRARGTLDSLETTIKERMSELDTYDTKYGTTVYFGAGTSTLTDAAKTALADIAQKAQGQTGYLIEVAGFADSEGSPAVNQRISEQRADAVVAYLAQAPLSVPLRRIVNPTGLGTSNAVATNTTAQGRARNRRAEVKVLVNRGLTSAR